MRYKEYLNDRNLRNLDYKYPCEFLYQNLKDPPNQNYLLCIENSNHDAE